MALFAACGSAADLVISAEEGRQVVYGVVRGLRIAADLVISAEEGRQVVYGVVGACGSPPTRACVGRVSLAKGNGSSVGR